ncbi:MAG: GAF domain-containing protein [Deltaproteobacteria bacterium]|nr:GAF domain-containing protein [Deltaproteobacteria bacterium]
MGMIKWLHRIGMGSQGLHYRLTLAFGLFFLVPVFGFLFFAVKYNILEDEQLPFYFIGLLVMSFLGFFILRKVFDKIAYISKNVHRAAEESPQGISLPSAADELQGIVSSFQSLQQELKTNFLSLEKKTAEIFTLKELSELCYITLNPEDLLYITLERALKMANADIGAMLILENPKRDVFIVEATIGQGEFVRRGERINYADSIAKYAVINKSPLVVENIETDIRFGRQSRPQYATKSFICMPLKTISDVIGVMTISRKKDGIPFTQTDVDVLTPLLGSAAFTYDNIRLLKENADIIQMQKSLENIFKVLNSSLRSSELYQSIFREVRETIPFETAIMLGLDKDAPDRLSVVDFLTYASASISRGNSFAFEGSVFDKVLRQQRTLMIENTSQLSHPVDEAFFINRGFRTSVIAPLVVEERITGLLVLCNVVAEALPDARKHIDTMAATLAISLERERLLVSEAKQYQALETIRQVSGALSTATFDMEKVLAYTMDMIRVAMNVKAGALLLLDGDELQYEIAFNLDMESLRGLRLRLGQDIAGHAAANGKTIVASDAPNHPHYSPAFDRITGFKTTSVLCVPMISQGKVTGAIEVRNKIDGLFNENDIHLLQSIATSLTIAMENARLYRETVTMAENERGIRNVFQKFVPKEIVDKIILGSTGEKPLIDEFKTLTLLNIDIRGFSKFSKNLGPQKTLAIVNHFFAAMGEIIFKHHGIVDKYLGDGLLALFGAPMSSPSDADNAITAAIEMRQAMDSVNEYVRTEFDTTLSMGISIHTGEVVVGNIGFEKKMDYTVIGDPVNILFKLQAICKSWPNSILISEKTRHAAQSRLHVEEMGPFEEDPAIGDLKIFKLMGRQS